MAGNKNSGRGRTPLALLKMRGTYREDRHGDRSPPATVGVMVKPSDLADEVSVVWDDLVVCIAPGVAAAGDSRSFRQMCELWVLYSKAFKVALDDPLNKDARIAVTGYKSAFEATAGKFGLTPVDRERISAAETNKPATVRQRNRA